MKKNFLFCVIASATIFLAISCSKNDEDTNTPAFRINASENIEIPAEIVLPSAGAKRVSTLYAEGVQKYKAQLKPGTISTFEWVFVAPRADLYDMNNTKVGTHSAGPTWQLFGGNDSCFAQQFAPVKAAISPEGAIDWLLLTQKNGKINTGKFSTVNYVQRIVTTGGKAPVTAPASLTDTIDVKYTAVYRFSTAN